MNPNTKKALDELCSQISFMAQGCFQMLGHDTVSKVCSACIDLQQALAEDKPHSTNRKYLMAIRVNADDGGAMEGNFAFEIGDELLTARHLEIVKERYCAAASAARGSKLTPEKAIVFSVIALEA